MEDAGGTKKKSLNFTWKQFHFPLSESLFKADNVDPNEWFLIYRIKWSIKAIYTIIYIQLGAFITTLVLMFKMYVLGVNMHVSSIADERYHKPVR